MSLSLTQSQNSKNQFSNKVFAHSLRKPIFILFNGENENSQKILSLSRSSSHLRRQVEARWSAILSPTIVRALSSAPLSDYRSLSLSLFVSGEKKNRIWKLPSRTLQRIFGFLSCFLSLILSIDISWKRRFWLPKEPVSLALTLWFSFSMKALGFRSSTILIISSPKLLIGFVICSALSVLRILNSTWYSFLCACVCKFLFCLVTEKMREKKVRNQRFLNILRNACFNFRETCIFKIFFF